MGYRVKGTLKLPDGTPGTNCEIEFTSRKNFTPVLTGMGVSIRTDSAGAYDVTLEYGAYAVILRTGNTYPTAIGQIIVASDTVAGQDLPTLLQRDGWQPATPEYVQQIRVWLSQADKYAQDAKQSADDAASTLSSTVKKDALTSLGGELDPAAAWSGVPAHSDAEIGGPLNAQAEALAARTKLLRTEVVEALRRSYAEAGYNVVGTFGGGFTIVNANDVGIDLATGNGYTGPAGAVAAGTNPASGGFINRSGSIYGLATVADISTGRFSVGALLRVSDRNYEIFRVVSGGTANNIDILPAGSDRTAVIADLSGIKSARAFGAKLDWDGVTGTDETAVFQRIHELGVNYAMDGKFSKITATLPMKSNQKVYFFGGGFYKPNSGYILSTNNVAVDSFIGYNGYFTGNLQADLIDMSGAGGGYPNSAKNCKLIDCNATQMYMLFNMSNARACQIVRGRYAGHTALQYTNKSAECIIESALLIKDKSHPTAGTKGVWAFAGADGYPEGLTVKDSLIFRFERNYAIDDLFIGKFHGNYVDSGDDCLQSYVRYGTKTEGVDVVNNWFFQRGLVIGKPGEVAPRQFRMLVDGNHFNAMKPGVDIEIEKWSHGVNLGINHHSSDQTGVHVCVTALGNNNGIIIQGLNPIGYAQYVQMKGAGEHNTISNIPNVDGLAAPLSLEYPVNVYNVEGYYSLSEGTLSASPYVAGAVVASADNILLSAGVAHLSFVLSRVSIAGDGFLRVVAYKAGTFDQDDAVIISAVSWLASYSSGDTSIRFSFPVAVKKATKTTFAVVVHTGSATITGGVIGSDGIVVMQ